jgi:hypothetical protein
LSYQAEETGFELPSQDGVCAQTSEVRRVFGGIETKETEMCIRVYLANTLHRLDSHARGHVHRNVKSDDIGGSNRIFTKGIDGKIKTLYREASAAQPCCRRGEAKRLASHLVSRKQKNLQFHRLGIPISCVCHS